MWGKAKNEPQMTRRRTGRPWHDPWVFPDFRVWQYPVFCESGPGTRWTRSIKPFLLYFIFSENSIVTKGRTEGPTDKAFHRDGWMDASKKNLIMWYLDRFCLVERDRNNKTLACFSKRVIPTTSDKVDFSSSKNLFAQQSEFGHGLRANGSLGAWNFLLAFIGVRIRFVTPRLSTFGFPPTALTLP